MNFDTFYLRRLSWILFIFWLPIRKIIAKSWKKSLDFITMKKAMILMRTLWKHNYKFFLKTFLLKNTCFFMIFIIASNRWNRAEVGKFLELVLVLPATNVTSDRNFSKMKLIKNPIRSTMSHECLNHCMIFSTHKEKVDKLKNLQN